MRIWLHRSIAVVVLATLLTGCYLRYDQRGGPAIADAIREASPPSVLEVDYVAGDYMDPSRVDVTMDGSVAEAEAFLCDVVEPIVHTGDPPDSLGVTVYDSDGEILAVDFRTPCP
jgi:hypothetical protein